MNKELREKVPQSKGALIEAIKSKALCDSETAIELITLIRTATLDEVKKAIINAKIDKDSTPIHNAIEAIDNLRGGK